MKPLFTVHAGEYLVGSHIEREFKNLRVWIPSKDSGVDLLVTNSRCTKSLRLQVKSSKDYLPHMKELSPDDRVRLVACGWASIDRSKLTQSEASIWVFVLLPLDRGSRQYILMKPSELIARTTKKGTLQVYFWVTKSGKCWLTRGLQKTKKKQLLDDKLSDTKRDITQFLNNWSEIQKLSKSHRQIG